MNLFGTGGSLVTASQHVLYFPSGNYRISNTLVYVGSTSLGAWFVGETTQLSGIGGTQISWFGPNLGTMWLVIGANSTQINNIQLDPRPSGGGSAQNSLWLDSTSEQTPTSVSISAISRTANIVTATVGTNTFTSPQIVHVTGVADTSYNGYFRVLYATATTVSWIQGGANTSSSGGTAANFQSAGTSSIFLNNDVFGGAVGNQVTISSIAAGASPYTITTSTSANLNVGDVVVVNGSVTDTSYLGSYVITSVSSPGTTATMLPSGAHITAISGAGSTGGTLTSGAVDLRIAHRSTISEEVAQITGYNLSFQGNQLGTSVVAAECDEGGNVKNFTWNEVVMNGYRYGFYGFVSGTFTMIGYDGNQLTPDSSPNLADIDFLQIAGNVFISGAETEATSNRFLNATASPASGEITLNAISIQSAAPTDDITMFVGAPLVITGSQFENARSSTSVPFIEMGTGLTSGASLTSYGNLYTNTAILGSGPSPGYIPVVDGNGNVFQGVGSLANTEALNITSEGDFGTATDTFGTATPLNNVGLMNFIAFGSPSLPSIGIPNIGQLRLPSGYAMESRNAANTNNVMNLSTNGSDWVIVGDQSGISPETVSPNVSYFDGSAVFGGAATFDAPISVAPITGVTQDATSHWYTPASAGEWATLLVNLGISAGPTNLWLLQETSGTTNADSIGSEALTNNNGGSPSFAQSVTGWTRKAMQTGTGTSQRLQGTGPNPSTTSVAVLAYVSIVTTPTATSTVYEWFNNLLAARATTTPVINILSGANNTSGVANMGTTVHPVLLVSNHTLQTQRLYTDQENISVAYSSDNSTVFLFGGISNSATVNFLYAAQWTGSSAEFTPTQAQALIARLVNAPSTFGQGVLMNSVLNKGKITLSGGTGSATVLAGAGCTCNDTSALANCQPVVSGTTLTITGSGTDVIQYNCN